MLLNFSFSNYRSFRDSQQFSFEPIAGKKEQGPVRVAAVYGANATGKSDFIEAIKFVSVFVRSGYSSGDGQSRIPITPFLLDSNSPNKESEFSIEFEIYSSKYESDIKYEYSFGITKSEVTYENLIAYYSQQPSLLFERISEDGGQSIKFGSAFVGPKKQLWKITRDNALFISVAAAAGCDVIQPVYSALTDGIAYYNAPGYLAELTAIKKLFLNDKPKAQMLATLLKFADIGIDDLDMRQAEGLIGVKDPFVDQSEIPEDVRRQMSEDFKWSFAYDLYFHHRGLDGGNWFSSAQESEGTKAALAFFSVALRSLEQGDLTVIDELDLSLHPTLLRDFVALFSDATTNPNGAQLIFTTHDVSLMTRTSSIDEVLDRDQIWFVEKDPDGASQLIAAMEYSPRASENIGRNYLNGVYVPLPNPSFHQVVAGYMQEGVEAHG